MDIVLEVEEYLGGCDSDQAKNALRAGAYSTGADAKPVSLEIDACVEVRSLFSAAVTRLEGVKYPALPLVLPVIDHLLTQLQNISCGLTYVDRIGKTQIPSRQL